ncbi:MAG TPA: DUF1992 domain-containing protein [Bryobacteraceae bacterium]|nr:DUF1992 domain-containing protein [Bryobacteraceae bacterium]
MDKWQSIADRKIQEAMESGGFDNLPDKGKPISLDRNPFEDPTTWMAHHLLQVNGFAPAWIEEARDIDATAARIRALLKDRSPRAIAEFRERGAELNRRILTYNLKCPSTQVHKHLLDLEAEIQAAKGR